MRAMAIENSRDWITVSVGRIACSHLPDEFHIVHGRVEHVINRGRKITYSDLTLSVDIDIDAQGEYGGRKIW